MEIAETILMVMVAVFALLGIVRLKSLMEKYQGVFGIFKAYLDILCLAICMAAQGKGIGLQILAIVGGIVVSYLLCFLFTKSLSPITWFDMQCYGWGWTFRKVLSIFGIAMPYIAERSAEKEAAYQRDLEERQRQEAIRDEIQADAYRKRGVRGQVNSDNTRWRADSDSDWETVHKS